MPAYRNRSKSRSKINFSELGTDNHCLRCGYTNHRFKDCRHPSVKFKFESCSRTNHVKKVCRPITTLQSNKTAYVLY